MKTFRSLQQLLLLAVCLGVASLPRAHAQAPALLGNGYRNVFGGPQPANPGGVDAPVAGDPLLAAYQAQRQGGTAFGGFPINGYGTLESNIAAPMAYDPAAVAYPRSTATTQVPGSVQLRSAIIGRPVAVFLTSYRFGGVIPPPDKIDLANGLPIPGFYRAEPLNARLKTTVVANSTTSEMISRTVVNATSSDLDGRTTTINGGETTTVTIGLNPQFYWSRHARKVYATQPGTIQIEWRESASTTARNDTYSIASSPDKPDRTIFWTENGFRGPPVEVPAGRLNAVNIIYNSLVPGDVAEPYAPWPAGVTDYAETNPDKRRYKTFYYENSLFHAYNVEGRVFVEYLGNPLGDGTNEPKGTEVVNLIKEITPDTLVVDLGEEVGNIPLADPDTGAPVALEPRIIAGLGLEGRPYLHQQTSAGGTKNSLYAIRETLPGVVVGGEIQQVSNEALVYWLETSPEGQLNLKWPRQYCGYVLQWPTEPARYSHYARPDAEAPGGLEATVTTAVQLDSANNPALVYQDDPANSQAVLAPGNKFYTKATQAAPTNRALLRFIKDDDIWFERVFSQLDPYYRNPADLLTRTVTGTPDEDGNLATGFTAISGVVVVNPANGQPYIEGTDYTVNPATGVIHWLGAGITAARVSFSSPTLPFSTVPALVDADIGTRIEPDPAIAADPYGDAAPVYVGHIHQPGGTAFDVDAYKDPFVAGFGEAAKGAIIGVNALAGNDQLEVWWYRKSTPGAAAITGTYWPSFVQRYKLRWPAAPSQIVLAGNQGSGDLPSLQAVGAIHTQNDPARPGYNPNEEHAVMLNGRAWALRDDLNIPASSEPYVLLRYIEADERPAMRVFKVTRGTFDYPAVAGKVLQAPMPLPLLPPPLLTDASRTLASYETGVAESFRASLAYGTTDSAFAHYQMFTWTDRKGILWVFRGPHDPGGDAHPSFKMRFFYATLPGFDFPGVTQPPPGTIVPYLRSGNYTPPVFDPPGTLAAWRTDQPLDITFHPTWPDSAPELRVGETLTLPKLGLPAVRGQASAELIYQQSVAMDPAAGMANRRKSARIFDPTRAKLYPLSPTKLASIPASVNTSPYLGKTYFPNLPPHLSGRLYFDPAIGANGSLVFKGQFMDELFGEKYLQLNVMTAADSAAAKGLVPGSDTAKSKWDAAIDGLATTVETFVEDPGKRGTFIPLRNESATPRLPVVINGSPFPIQAGAEPRLATAPAGTTSGANQRPPVLPAALAEIFSSDTAVDSYAISASGGGSGYVVLAVGNGRDTDFTPAGQPVALQVFKVNAPLYRGELKVINSQNPLDEKLTLQHTGDFAGHPEEYDFEWRYSQPVDGMPNKLYSFVHKLLVPGTGQAWTLIHNPVVNPLDPALDYTNYRSPGADVSGLPLVNLPGQTITINDGGGTPAHGTTLPNAVLRRTFSASTRPLRLFLSLDVAANDGALVYLNGAKVASYHAPGCEDTATTSVPATAPSFDPLPLVFEINANALVANPIADNNVFTVELFTTADAGSTTAFNLRLEGSQEVENLTGWLALTDPADVKSSDSITNNDVVPPTSGIVAVAGKNRHTIQGTSILTLSDNFIIMRYRAKNPANAAYQAGGGWSKWTEPQLAEGWIKRVLAGINPFQQRVKDLFNHETNTSVSLVEQAGKRWEGNIALNLDNINDSGLVEIYETVLNRGKDLSIGGTPGINYGGANDALLLAAGYLSDLYMILGNEAYADSSNSTIAFNTDGQAAQYGDVATALFSFKGQLATVLDEELALLRGRDDFLLPGSRNTPVYNRLVWNYTRGIDSGEAIYALNYNIKDRTWDYALNPNNPGSLPADGVISAADAAIAYPQGHGDAYGHYLTALTGYYGLLNNPNFAWTPRVESVLVLGVPVNVDYHDERKFASAAVAVARTASQIVDLTYRQEYSASANTGWSRLDDAKPNANTGTTRHWGTDDWASRGGQGALFHWATANSLLPAVDPNPNHSGIQQIDRTTVPELAEIAAQAAAIQQSLDHADARLNPLGLAEGALTFDISPADVDAGKTHYEQIHGRAIAALQNAVSAFSNAKASTQFLRQQEDTLEDQRNTIAAQEQAYTNQLIELYGTPYTDDVGPGKTYMQEYTGPDLFHYMYVDLPELFAKPSNAQREYVLLIDPQFIIHNKPLDVFGTADYDHEFNPGGTVSYTLSALGDVERPTSWSGRRVSPGRMQTAVSELLVARQALNGALGSYQSLGAAMNEQIALYKSSVDAYNKVVQRRIGTNGVVGSLIALKGAATLAKAIGDAAKETTEDKVSAAVEAMPKVVGVANDATSGARAAILTTGAVAKLSTDTAQIGLETFLATADDAIERLNFQYQSDTSEIKYVEENRQLLHGLSATLDELKGGAGAVDAALRHLDQARRNLYALQAEGDRIQQQRMVFRQHAAAIVQGYRTRDFAFRSFRNEALERYKALFDISARYTYLAARAYDYETGLLDGDGNASATGFYEKIVQARALGVVSNGVPQFAGASVGDPGLSGVLAELAGDWSVARTRLGFNNPDRYATTFSLRGEKFRLVPGIDGDLPWRDKLNGCKMANILDDPDVKRHCMQVANPDGTAVPGLVIPFSSTIATGYNFFGQPLAGGDHTFTPSSFSTKIRSSGIAFRGYVGMDSPTTTSGTLGDIGATSPSGYNTGFSDPQALSATPYIYLIPAGADSMRSPPLGDTSFIRTWAVVDQAIPLPFNIANSDYSSQPAWVSAASLTEPAFTLRKHQAFRAVPDGTNFQSGAGFTNARLIGRSAWNNQWKIVIPGSTLLNNPNFGIQTFISTVKDIKLHLETYSYSGN